MRLIFIRLDRPGLELAGLNVETRTGSLILETGVTQRWQYASYRKSPQTTQEAEEWLVRSAAAPVPGGDPCLSSPPSVLSCEGRA